jgi:hypothetical protein
MRIKDELLVLHRSGIRSVLLLSVLAAAGIGNAGAVTIDFQTTNLGQNLYRLSYLVSGIQFQTNQELDIRFDPALYGALTNGVAGPGYDLLLLQPGNPPGTFGDYSALALVDNPSLSTPFQVDVRFLGAGLPGPQPFLVNQLAPDGTLMSEVAHGNTGVSDGAAPEPAGWALAVSGLLIFGVWVAVRPRRA